MNLVINILKGREIVSDKLVIVESPSKAKTIKKYLGSSYDVIASQGHIIDLPKSKLGVDIEDNFKPKYITMKGKAKIVNEIKTKAKTLYRFSEKISGNG